ncbi:hypothetical protein GCM10017779_04960 [Streptomyces capillispiralis]|nr:hypothetical protein GCM10017779_04960 [Streptomyces capillispiralis]
MTAHRAISAMPGTNARTRRAVRNDMLVEMGFLARERRTDSLGRTGFTTGRFQSHMMQRAY